VGESVGRIDVGGEKKGRIISVSGRVRGYSERKKKKLLRLKADVIENAPRWTRHKNSDPDERGAEQPPRKLDGNSTLGQAKKVECARRYSRDCQ